MALSPHPSPPRALLAALAPPARRWARGLVDLVLPPRALDDGPMQAAQTIGLSPQSWGRIRFIEAPVCDACGFPFDFDLGAGALCASCLARRPVYDRARAACLYDEHSRGLILKLKHADRTDLAALFARWLARAGAEILREADAVAPVPLHRSRLLARRYNQAAEIARPLARGAGVSYWPDALVRVKATPSQGGRSGEARRRNLSGAVQASAAWRRRIEGRRVVLVDDVLTTGATVEACARALKSAGASAVDVLVIARVKDVRARAI